MKPWLRLATMALVSLPLAVLALAITAVAHMLLDVAWLLVAAAQWVKGRR